MIYKIANVLLMIFILVSCKPSSSDAVNYDWLVGAWQKEGTLNTERWHKINDLSYQGMGYINNDGKISVSEYLRLYKLNGHWNYSAIVQNQNDGKEVVFKSTNNCNDRILDVQLLSHDFPKSIKYELVKDSVTQITLNENLENQIKYQLKKLPYFEISIDR